MKRDQVRTSFWIKGTLLALGFICFTSQVSQAQLIPYNPRVERGATLGGVTGAVLGGVIGHQNDETTEGILIGGAVGAVTGGIIGQVQNQRDAEMRAAQQRAYSNGYRSSPNYYQQRQQQTYYQPRPTRQPVGVAEVVAMTRRGLPEQLIIQHIQLNGVRSVPTTEELLRMYDEGVSTTVIEVMQESALVEPQSNVTGTHLPSRNVTSGPSAGSNLNGARTLSSPRSMTQPSRTYYRRRF